MINSAAMNIGVHVSVSDLVSSVCMPGLPHFQIAPRSAAQSSRGLRDAINSARRATFLSWFKKKKHVSTTQTLLSSALHAGLLLPCYSPSQKPCLWWHLVFSCGGRILAGIRRWERGRAGRESAGCHLSLPRASEWQSWLEEGAVHRHEETRSDVWGGGGSQTRRRKWWGAPTCSLCWVLQFAGALTWLSGRRSEAPELFYSHKSRISEWLDTFPKSTQFLKTR